jgi:hypothetical protein
MEVKDNLNKGFLCTTSKIWTSATCRNDSEPIAPKWYFEEPCFSILLNKNDNRLGLRVA